MLLYVDSVLATFDIVRIFELAPEMPRFSVLVFYVNVLVMLYSIVYGFLEFSFWLNLLVRYWVWTIITRQINMSLIIITILFSFHF